MCVLFEAKRNGNVLNEWVFVVMVWTPTKLKPNLKSDNSCDFTLSSRKNIFDTRSTSITMPSKRRGRNSKNRIGINFMHNLIEWDC